MEVKTNFGVYNDCFLDTARYSADDSLCIQIYTRYEDGFIEPLATLTKCLNNNTLGGLNANYVDTNNLPWALDFIREYNLGVVVDGADGHSGFCAYPLVDFNLDEIAKYVA